MADNIAEEIRTWRESIPLSQVALARKLGISSQRLSNWENGRGTPSLGFVRALQALGFRGTAPLMLNENRTPYPSQPSPGALRIFIDLLYDCDQDPDLRASARRELYRVFELSDT